MSLSRITIDPRQMGGVPCIRRLRLPVATVVDMVAEGLSATEILEAYPDLVADDIRDARIAFEKRYLERKLAEHGGNISRTSLALGLERSNLYRKMKAYGMAIGEEG